MQDQYNECAKLLLDFESVFPDYYKPRFALFLVKDLDRTNREDKLLAQRLLRNAVKMSARKMGIVRGWHRAEFASNIMLIFVESLLREGMAKQAKLARFNEELKGYRDLYGGV